MIRRKGKRVTESSKEEIEKHMTTQAWNRNG